MSFKKVKDILNQLTQEHVIFLKKTEELKEKLDNQFSEDVLDELMDFIKKDVLEHARVEEEDLEKALEEAGITDFDVEALNFGHRTLDEIIQHLEYLIDLYKKGERKYRGRDLKSEIIKTADEFFQTLKDHFTEEEDFFFPDILKYDIERFE
ncbi:hemerythrin domain-containing protein [Persephonella sp.]|uniref:hemerythrin domain-containing protein n=1 Tax=Persephonella sp. TaxID=2060922 RepID=UPI0025DB637A|nr:hemerythrin domain-containing protein [Persephonella sp.]